ncbi:hypothetical protein GCM10009606_25610 [Nocardioides aquiterrae]|uniref:O-antigen ligase domain-containing protein n=1 Tax=Nocardioides aquiterrae TaxID=203799 RepID=A0ABN1UF11_9ACTN
MAAVFYSSVLFYAYRDFVSPTFASTGLTFRAPTPGPYVLSVFLVAFVTTILPRRLRRPSDFVLWMFFVLAAAPAILLSQYMQTLPTSEATELGIVIAACMVLIRTVSSMRPRLPRGSLPNIPEGVVWIFLGWFAGITYIAVVASVGLRLQWLSFADVYDVRSDFTATYAAIPGLGYALPIVFNVINPTFIARGIYSNRWQWVVAGAAGQVLIYTTTGLKSVLFSILAIAAIAFLFRRSLRPRGIKLLAGTFYVVVVAVALDSLFHTIMWNTMLIRRFIVIPGSLVVSYVGVFDDRPRGLFRGDGGPIFWLDPVYTQGPSHIVSQVLIGNPLGNANVNLFGHGYFQYGYLGIFIEGIVLAVLLWLLDAASRGLPTPVVALILVMPAFAISGTNIFTAMTTHGLLAAVLILAVLPRTGWGKQLNPASSNSRMQSFGALTPDHR